MRESVFLFKDNSEDRDCVAYTYPKAMRFECDNYFSGVHIFGAAYHGRNWDDINYNDIKTILTHEEFNQLIQFDKDIYELGYGIKQGDKRYQKGVELCEKIQLVFDKLNSEENKKLFAEIITEETEYLMDEYALEEEDVESIFNHYYAGYKDRGIVSCIFNDIDDCAYEEAWSYGYVTEGNERWFDYEKFGRDLLEEERYYELSDGRIIVLNY